MFVQFHDQTCGGVGCVADPAYCRRFHAIPVNQRYVKCIYNIAQDQICLPVDMELSEPLRLLLYITDRETLKLYLSFKPEFSTLNVFCNSKVLSHMELKHGHLTKIQNQNLCRWKLICEGIGEIFKIRINKKQCYNRKSHQKLASLVSG